MTEYTCRSGRHVITGASDRAANGGCRKCQQINKRAYSASCREARRTLRTLQAALAS